MGKRRNVLKKPLPDILFWAMVPKLGNIASKTVVFLHISSGFAWHLWFVFRCLTVFIVVAIYAIFPIWT